MSTTGNSSTVARGGQRRAGPRQGDRLGTGRGRKVQPAPPGPGRLRRPAGSPVQDYGTELPIDPRIEERRAEVRREQRRWRRRALVALAALTALLVGGLIVLHSSLVGVRRVLVSGRSEVSRSELLGDAGIRVHEPLVDVSVTRAQQRLEALAWVDTARVVREWPTTLRVVLTVRRPVAQLLRGASSRGPVALVDSSGRVVAESSSVRPGLPLLVGVGPPVPLGDWLAGSAGAGRHPAEAPGGSSGALDPGPALALAAALDADHLAATEVRVGADGAVSVLIGGGATDVAFGPPTDLVAKIRVLRALSVAGALVGAGRVDLTVPERPTVAPGGGSRRATGAGVLGAQKSLVGSAGKAEG